MATIVQVDNTTFIPQGYEDRDVNVLPSASLDTTFDLATDYIEFYALDSTQNVLHSNIPHRGFSVVTGSVTFDPSQNLETEGYNEGEYFTLYNFYRQHLNSSPTQRYYISEISGDRTEIRLASTTIENDDIESSTNAFVEYRNNSEFFIDFYLNFGDNERAIANNAILNLDQNDNPTVLVKLYNPLPAQYDINTQLWVVEELSVAQAYRVDFPFEVIEEQDFEFIAGPNFNLNISTQVGESSEVFSLNTLAGSNISSSTQQLNSLLANQGIEINVNYEDFNEFVNFSSARTRLDNFIHKVGLIESASNQIDLLPTSSDTLTYSSSKAVYDRTINTTITNFDNYEYFLYYNSGSKWSYPKSNDNQPYTLYSTGSTVVDDWLTNVRLSASNYDDNNQNYLQNVIPEYLRSDPANANYEIFVDMMGQHYDSIWTYTKDITNKFSADNRLDYGISKDLVAEAIKDFGVKLYSNNFNTQDLYQAFLGIGENNQSLAFVTGSEQIDTLVSASNDVMPLDGANKRLYKRLYHNLPYLLKTKGTAAGIRALITSFGIPDTILQVNEFGGQTSEQWDYSKEVFNYKFVSKEDISLGTRFEMNPIWGSADNRPETVAFRFQTLGTDNFVPSQSIFGLDNGGSLLTLEHTGSLNVSGSYSGSVKSPYNNYGTLTFTPHSSSLATTASVSLPFYDGDWWTVMITKTGSLYELTAANKLEYGNGEVAIGQIASSSITSTSSMWDVASNAFFGGPCSISNLGSKPYTRLSGSLQEIRYYNKILSKGSFNDFVVNPSSYNAGGVNDAESSLMFRLPLGNEMHRGMDSIHPKTKNNNTSPFATSSFTDSVFTLIGDNAEFTELDYLLQEDDNRIKFEMQCGFILVENTSSLTNDNFINNKEVIFQSTPQTGVKNRVTNKIRIVEDTITGDTLSAYRSNVNNAIESVTPNTQYSEVAFSPQDQINDDISGQLGRFNIGDYIGDPRDVDTDTSKYPDLDRLRDSYFDKYTKSYDVRDFVRLIKFLDNSLFKMIQDFVPAQTAMTAGVVVKSHLLERNKVKAVQVGFGDITYSGSVKSAVQDFKEDKVHRDLGGSGGTFEVANNIENSPEQTSGTQLEIEQVWGKIVTTKDGLRVERQERQTEFYDGVFGGPVDIDQLENLISGGADLRGQDGSSTRILSKNNGFGGTSEDCGNPDYKDYFLYAEFITTPPDCDFNITVDPTPIQVVVNNAEYKRPAPIVTPPTPGGGGTPSLGGGGTPDVSDPPEEIDPEDIVETNNHPIVFIVGDSTADVGNSACISADADPGDSGQSIVSYNWSNGQSGESICVPCNSAGEISITVTVTDNGSPALSRPSSPFIITCNEVVEEVDDPPRPTCYTYRVGHDGGDSAANTFTYRSCKADRLTSGMVAHGDVTSPFCAREGSVVASPDLTVLPDLNSC